MSFATLLADVIERLDRAGVPFMVTGSLASSYHGVPRSTADADIVIDPNPDELDRLVDLLLEGDFYVDRTAASEAIARRSQFNAIRRSDSVKVDFIIRKDRPFSVEEFSRRERADLLGVRGFVATAEDVVLSKLEWAAETDSERQIRDAASIVEVDPELDVVYVERWAEALGVADAWHAIHANAG